MKISNIRVKILMPTVQLKAVGNKTLDPQWNKFWVCQGQVPGQARV